MPDALDAEGAIRAATASSLAQGLVIAAAAVCAVAAVVLLARARRAGPSGVVSWRHVLAGAAVVLCLGGVVGVGATLRNGQVLAGTGPLEALRDAAAGPWFTVAVLLGAGGAWVGFRTRVTPGPGRVAPIAVVAPIVMVGTLLAPDLPQPERQVTVPLPIAGGAQATAVLVPGAAGDNALRVGLSGPAASVRGVRRLVDAGGARADLRALATGERSPVVPVTVGRDGELTAAGLVASSGGRWRLTLRLSPDADAATADVTLQPNPGYRP